ncbi:unnamed protein product, partial [Rotaria sp. Silwood2]
MNKLISKLQSDQKGRALVEESLPIDIFHLTAIPDQSTTMLNGNFVHSQLLIDILLRIETNRTDINPLVSFCKKFYKGNKSQLRNIQEFKDTYSANRALW